MPRQDRYSEVKESKQQETPHEQFRKEKLLELAAFEKELEDDKDGGSGENRLDLLNQLRELLPKEDKAGLESKHEDGRLKAKAEALRKACLAVLAHEIPTNKLFCDKIFKLLLLLAHLWPFNDLEGGAPNGEPKDGISLFPISPENRIPLANGWLYDKGSFQEYLNRTNIYVQDPQTGDLKVIDPWRNYLLKRDFENLEKMGISIPVRNARLNRAVVGGNWLGMNGRIIEGISYREVIQLLIILRYHRLLVWLAERTDGPSGFRTSAYRAGLEGYIWGKALAVCLLIILHCIASLLYTNAGFIAIWVTGIICGMIEAKRSWPTGDSVSRLYNFNSGVISVLLGGAIVFMLAYLVPLIVFAIGGSSPSVIAAMAIWRGIQPFLPVLVGLIGAIREFFTPGAMKGLFEGIIEPLSSVFCTLSAVVCGLIGGVVGWIAYKCRSARQQPPAVPQPAQPGVGVGADEGLGLRYNNVLIHNAVGNQPANPGGGQLDAADRGAIRAVLREDGYDSESVQAVLIEQAQASQPVLAEASISNGFSP